MSVAVPVSEDERHRLETCVREPIRVPGAIQAHGALLSFDLSSFEILQASSNAIDVLGMSAAALTGCALDTVVGPEAVESCRAIVQRTGVAANPVPVTVMGRRFDAIVHGADGVGIVEFEPVVPGDLSAAPVHAAIHRLSSAATVDELFAEAAREISELTGFDRVVVYEFHADGHGEIVAEQVADGMDPYLGLHFPASDIPSQARDLYLSKMSRVIVLDDRPPAPLVPVDNPVTHGPLDLGHAELRSVSEHHVQFMKNMGQVTTMSLSLVYVDQLIGMITCSHRTARRIPYVRRQAFEVLARQVALQWGAATEIDRLRRLETVRAVRSGLSSQVRSGDDIRVTLVDGEFTLLDLIPADGATLHLHGVSTSMGDAPDVTIGPELLAELTDTPDAVVVSESIRADFPRLQALMPRYAGVLIVPFGGEGDYLAWFRREAIATVSWLGDQTATNRDTALSPRTSFESWSESVAGRSEPWDQVALHEATEIRHDLNEVLLRVAESELAQVALHDPLTGLPNRRLLSDRIGQALAKRDRAVPAALLFADLDGFKRINDTVGHGVGDAVIIAAATRIREVLRSQDTVARIGGDEFVVLCEDAGSEEASIAAERILEAFSTPLEVDGGRYELGISIGIALAEEGQSPEDLLHAADEAMYRAKDRGKGQSSF